MCSVGLVTTLLSLENSISAGQSSTVSTLFLNSGRKTFFLWIFLWVKLDSVDDLVSVRVPQFQCYPYCDSMHHQILSVYNVKEKRKTKKINIKWDRYQRWCIYFTWALHGTLSTDFLRLCCVRELQDDILIRTLADRSHLMVLLYSHWWCYHFHLILAKRKSGIFVRNNNVGLICGIESRKKKQSNKIN